MYGLIGVLLVFVCTFVKIAGLDNGLGLTPPMGWLAWERYRCATDCNNPLLPGCVNETLFKRMADKMIADGYRDAGYIYVNIDDCWSAEERDKDGILQPDPDRFPNGIKHLSDYMHARGLKLGIYADIGKQTCAKLPGSKYYLERDAKTFADWDVDMLKLDGCFALSSDLDKDYPLMGKFLNDTGRPILYSCSWPGYLHKTPPYKDIAKYCNIWRNWNDIQDSWSSVTSIINYWAKDEGNFSAVAGPGHFNDPDMLIIGDYGLSYDQQKSQMAIWSITASPLLMSVDLYSISPASRAILLNEGAIAVNQDALGIQGTRVKYIFPKISVWTKPLLPEGSWAIAVLNMGDYGAPREFKFKLVDINIDYRTSYEIKEIFNNDYMGIYNESQYIRVAVNPSGVQFLQITPINLS